MTNKNFKVKGVSNMNKKMLVTAIAVALSIGCAQATEISGITGNNGVYNINPDKINGDVGFRQYEKFNLSQGDIANLIFQGTKNGQIRDLESFVNLVNNKVNINGVLNTVRNGNFHNGHAIFITPGGFVVGQSGVLNVGRLSVATPTAAKYDELTGKYVSGDLQGIGRQVSALTQNSKEEAGAADITINGKVFARNGVEMTGKNVSVSGAIVNGINSDSAADLANILTSEEQANELFNTLVNTNGLKYSYSPGSDEDINFVQNGSRILIKSTKGMNISGTVANGAGNVYLTNNGTDGMNVSGIVDSKNLTRLFNTKGDLSVNETAKVKSNVQTIVQNKGDNLTLGKNTVIQSNRNIEVINQGTGRLTASGSILSQGDPSSWPTGKHIAISNMTGSGMTVEGLVSLADGEGEVAINNHSGDMIINGKILSKEKGNMGINNYGSGMTITKNAEITNVGKLKIANSENGSDGMTIVGNIKNSNGDLRIYNDAGRLKLTTDSNNTTAANISNKDGKLYIVSRKNGTGIQQSTTSTIANENGNIVIRNSGTKTEAGTRGLDLQGTVTDKNGTIAINNDYGDMYVSSNVSVENGNLGIINRASGGKMDLASAGNVTVIDGNANIKNFGTGDMTVNSTIAHNGRVNVIANSGMLYLGGKVHNNSGALGENGGFYATSRKNGKGINVSSEFVVDGNGEILIKNISGENGLRYNGTINTTNNQAALVNKTGDMEVSGKITTTNAPIIISNQGKKLTVLNSTELNSGTEGKLVNTGSEAATIGSKAKLNNVKTYEKVKKAEEL